MLIFLLFTLIVQVYGSSCGSGTSPQPSYQTPCGGGNGRLMMCGIGDSCCSKDEQSFWCCGSNYVCGSSYNQCVQRGYQECNSYNCCDSLHSCCGGNCCYDSTEICCGNQCCNKSTQICQNNYLCVAKPINDLQQS